MLRIHNPMLILVLRLCLLLGLQVIQVNHKAPIRLLFLLFFVVDVPLLVRSIPVTNVPNMEEKAVPVLAHIIRAGRRNIWLNSLSLLLLSLYLLGSESYLLDVLVSKVLVELLLEALSCLVVFTVCYGGSGRNWSLQIPSAELVLGREIVPPRLHFGRPRNFLFLCLAPLVPLVE